MNPTYPDPMEWDLWIDYHRQDEDGLTHASVLDASPGVALRPGAYVVVGNEEADRAVAEVVSVDDEGIVLVRVLPGPADDHLHLIPSPRHEVG
jgi:hypothetical protein